jgi:hypothetical protein
MERTKKFLFYWTEIRRRGEVNNFFLIEGEEGGGGEK